MAIPENATAREILNHPDLPPEYKSILEEAYSQAGLNPREMQSEQK